MTILREWLFFIISFTALMYFYYFLTWWGLAPYFQPNLFNGYVSSGYALFEIGTQGVFFGIMFGLINLLFEKTRLGRRSFGATILIKTVLYSIAVALSQIVVLVIYQIFGIFSTEEMRAMQLELYPPFILSMSLYFVFVILLISFVFQINRKFGSGILLSMITGKYYKPRKERRIFMFLDMKDSTGTAERLGHVKYSQLIQSCIHELTDLIPRYKAQVYQYVGDEVVLTWPTGKGIKDLNCINLYYAMKQRLQDRTEYYNRKFNTLPEFKAGMSEGVVTVTEVGDIKRELAYHGEVLHTAARLEKMCNNLHKNILLTENVFSKLPERNGYEVQLMGEFQLRGKEGKDKVYGIKVL